MLVTYGGKQGNIHICEAHAKALRTASPFSGAKFTKVEKQKHGEWRH